MLREIWDRNLALLGSRTKALKSDLKKLDTLVEQLLERVLEAGVPSVIAAYEDRIRQIEERKLVLRDQIKNEGHPESTYDATVRTALRFLASAWNIYKNVDIDAKRIALKLAFADSLNYKRDEGFRTTNLTSPFKVLGGYFGEKKTMAHPTSANPDLEI